MRGFILTLAILSIVSASPYGLLRRESACPTGACETEGTNDCCKGGILSCGSDFKFHFKACKSGSCRTDPDSGDATCV